MLFSKVFNRDRTIFLYIEPMRWDHKIIIIFFFIFEFTHLFFFNWLSCRAVYLLTFLYRLKWLCNNRQNFLVAFFSFVSILISFVGKTQKSAYPIWCFCSAQKQLSKPNQTEKKTNVIRSRLLHQQQLQQQTDKKNEKKKRCETNCYYFYVFNLRSTNLQ